VSYTVLYVYLDTLDPLRETSTNGDIAAEHNSLSAPVEAFRG